MKVIDQEEAERLLNMAVKEYGESYVYSPLEKGVCAYLHPANNEPLDLATSWKPGCIVGVAMLHAGVPEEVLLDNNFVGASSLAAILTTHGYEFTPAAVRLLWTAQEAQDSNVGWAEAVRIAKAETDIAVQRFSSSEAVKYAKVV